MLCRLPSNPSPNSSHGYAPGECFYSQTVCILLNAVEEAMLVFIEPHNTPGEKAAYLEQSALNIYQNSAKIIEMCEVGSRSWQFFNSLAAMRL